MWRTWSKFDLQLWGLSIRRSFAPKVFQPTLHTLYKLCRRGQYLSLLSSASNPAVPASYVQCTGMLPAAQ